MYAVEPFILHVKSINKNIGKLHPMGIGKLLFNTSLIREGIKEISTIGINEIKIECSSAIIAIITINGNFLEKENINVFIPKYLRTRSKIIFNVDPDLKVNKNLQEIVSDISVVEAKCSKYKNIIRSKYSSRKINF